VAQVAAARQALLARVIGAELQQQQVAAEALHQQLSQQIAKLPPPSQGEWEQIGHGHTTDCRLYWVQVGQTNPEPNSDGQLLFFDRQTPLGPATPEPRPYINVVTNADDAVVVNYQWQQGQDPPCCPTGVGTVRFRIGDDGKLVAVDPIPGPNR